MSAIEKVSALLPTKTAQICTLLVPCLGVAVSQIPDWFLLILPTNQEAHIQIVRVTAFLAGLSALSLMTIFSLVRSTYGASIDLRAAMQAGEKRVLASQCQKDDCPQKLS